MHICLIEGNLVSTLQSQVVLHGSRSENAYIDRKSCSYTSVEQLNSEVESTVLCVVSWITCISDKESKRVGTSLTQVSTKRFEFGVESIEFKD